MVAGSGSLDLKPALPGVAAPGMPFGGHLQPPPLDASTPFAAQGPGAGMLPPGFPHCPGFDFGAANSQAFDTEVVRRAMERVQVLLGQTGALLPGGGGVAGSGSVGGHGAMPHAASSFGQSAMQQHPFSAYGGFKGNSSFQPHVPAGEQPVSVSGGANVSAPRADGPCCGDSDTIGGADNDGKKASSGAGTSQAFSEVHQGENAADTNTANGEPQSRNDAQRSSAGAAHGVAYREADGLAGAKGGQAAGAPPRAPATTPPPIPGARGQVAARSYTVSL